MFAIHLTDTCGERPPHGCGNFSGWIMRQLDTFAAELFSCVTQSVNSVPDARVYLTFPSMAINFEISIIWAFAVYRHAF